MPVKASIFNALKSAKNKVPIKTQYDSNKNPKMERDNPNEEGKIQTIITDTTGYSEGKKSFPSKVVLKDGGEYYKKTMRLNIKKELKSKEK